MIPSELFVEPGTLALNAGREKRTLKVDRTAHPKNRIDRDAIYV
jgi:hypothetical protein